MAQNILGIDLGSFAVKLVLIERRARTFRLIEFIEQPLNQSSRLSHEEQVALALEQLFAQRKLAADVVCVSLSGHLLSSRLIDIPLTQAKKIAQAIEFELEGFVPMPIEDLHFDHHVLHTTAESSKVLCVYILNEKFGHYMDAVAKSGFEAKYISADFVDLAGIAQVGMVPHDGCYMLLDLGHNKTNVCIMAGKDLKYVRTIGIGGHHFTRAIQRVFNLNFEKAESLKLTRGKLFVREEDTDQVARIISKVGGDLVSAIKQTVMGYHNAYGQNHSIDAVYCCGGTARMHGLLDFLSFHLRTNVLDLDVLNFFNHQLENAEEIAHVIPQSIAAAMRPVYSGRIPKINLRKGPYAFKQDVELITGELKMAGWLLLGLFLLGLAYYFYASSYYTHKTDLLVAKVERVVKETFPNKPVANEEGEDKGKKGKKAKKEKGSGKDAKSRLEKVKKQIDDQVAMVGGQDAILNRIGAVSVLKVLEEISKNLPPKKEVRLQITNLSYADNFVRLEGRTVDYEKVGQIVAALSNSPMFTSVESKNEQKTKNDELKFVLNINLEALAPVETAEKEE